MDELSSDENKDELNNLFSNDIVKGVYTFAKILAKAHKLVSSKDENDNAIELYDMALNELADFLSEKNKKVLVLLDSFVL